MTGNTDPPGIRALARHLNSNPGSVTRWLRKGMPADFAGATAWRATHARQRVKATPPAAHAEPGEAAGSFTHWRTRRECAQALQAELDLRERRGELMRVDDVRHALADRFVAAKAIVLSLSPRLAPILAPESDVGQIARLLDAEMRRFLQELATAGDALTRNEKADDHAPD